MSAAERHSALLSESQPSDSQAGPSEPSNGNHALTVSATSPQQTDAPTASPRVAHLTTPRNSPDFRTNSPEFRTNSPIKPHASHLANPAASLEPPQPTRDARSVQSRSNGVHSRVHSRVQEAGLRTQTNLRAAILDSAAISGPSGPSGPLAPVDPQGQTAGEQAINLSPTGAPPQPTSTGDAKQTRAEGQTRANRATAPTTNSTHSNHSREHSHDHSRDSSRSRNAPSTTYASSSDSDHSPRISKDPGLGVSPGSPTPPGSSDGPHLLPSADALRLIADSSTLSASTIELPIGNSPAAPSAANSGAIPRMDTPQGSDATSRAAAVEQLRARVLQETTRVRSFNGQATLHFSAEGLGELEMRVQRTEQGWEVILRSRERQADELLQAERRRILSALQDIDDDISFELETDADDHPKRHPRHTVINPHPHSIKERPSPSPRQVTRVLSSDGSVDIVA